MKNTAFVVSGVIFALIALMHLVRLFLGTSVVVEGYAIPRWISAPAFIVAGIMAAWMFKSSCCCTPGDEKK